MRIYEVALLLREEEYQKLKKEADKQKISMYKLCERIIRDWLKRRL